MTALRKACCVAIILAASAAVQAAEPAQHPCAQVRDDTDRLACYDSAFGKPAKPAPAAEQFGRPAKPAPAAAAAPASVTAAVTALDRLRDGKFVVTLDNSQVWSQSEINSQALVAIGDTVTVRRAALGSYLLVTKAGIATRVKRVR
jgi:hypothetical protein